jgi:TolB-like protein/Tfp pilus assembly protein PilF
MAKPQASHRFGPSEPREGDRLDSWKEIAAHLNRDVRTLFRWEAQEKLPVYRHLHKGRSTVYAYRSELDAWRAGRQPHRLTPRKEKVMLAVLPFTNLGADSEHAYFSDGMTEELIAQLGRLSPDRLGVIARTSVMRFKGTLERVMVIGEELGVDYVVEGSVRSSAGRVRITAQLIQVPDESHVWAECYERDLSDILLLQNEIARAIAAEIHVTVTPEERRRLPRASRVDSDAYEAYLRGRFHWYKLSREHLDIAFDYFQLALKRDPDYALAHAGVAYVWLSRGDCGVVPSREAMARAKASAMKALELDDSLAEVHELLAGVKLHSEWDWSGAEQAYWRAIQLDPNHADAHFFYADLLYSMKRPLEAEAEATYARQLDPLNFLFRCFHGWHLVYLGRYDEAIAQLTQTLETEPNYPAAHLGLWGAFYKKTDYGGALQAAGTFFRVLGDERLSAVLTLGGDGAEYASAMGRAAETLAASAEHQHVPALRIARLYAHAGAEDRALDWLERACAQHEAPLVHLQVAWDWDCLREQPRFQALLRQVNFPPVTAQS